MREQDADLDDALLLASLLTLWSGCVYVASGWRGRIHSETQARMNARNTTDPLTGLATPLVLYERVKAARHMTKRYGHPSVLMLVHIENLPALAEEFGPEASESAVLTAAVRVRQALLRGGDVAARVAHARFAVLAEGAGTGEAAATVASRILVAGLKEPLPAAPAEFLHFRIVQAALPIEEIAPRDLLLRLSARLDQEVRGGSERRIATMNADDLVAAAATEETTY
jgi:diguanylate cyclase (GGDEF)-like protein